jgi:sucrose-6F-phosphate phosphohydrolase
MLKTGVTLVRQRLLATDLDGTLVGDRAALEALCGVLAPWRGTWRLAYVTGRSLASAQELARLEGLPDPDAWITDVGTAICDANGRPDLRWAAALRTGWDRERVVRVAGAWPGVRPQPPACQGPYKVSFYVDPAAATTLPALAATLAGAGQPTRLVYSSGRDLDLLPPRAGKGAALAYLARRWGLASSQVMACGDSGNDLDMLAHGGPAVAVGNSQAELLSRLPGDVYRARGSYAAGILEALLHYAWIG